MENVKNLVSKKFLPDLQRWLDELDAYGYTSYMQVLDAADYGVPQSRKRVFVVSILNDSEGYMFPQPRPLKLQMADLLEDDADVDDKYFLTDKQIACFTNLTAKAIEKGNGFRFKPTDGGGIAKTITTRSGSRTDDNFLLASQATKQGYAEVPDGGVFDGSFPNSTTPRGRVIGEGRISPTLQTSTTPMHYSAPYAIRKLTPRECLRLMDVRDHDIDKMINAGISNAQLYKLAGNSIVVEVIYQIFKNLLIK